MFWKSQPTKFIRLTDNEELKIVLSSVLIYLLSHKHCEATIEGQNGRVIKNFFSIFSKLDEVNVQSFVCKSFVSGTVYWFFWNLLKSFRAINLKNWETLTLLQKPLSCWNCGKLLAKFWWKSYYLFFCQTSNFVIAQNWGKQRWLLLLFLQVNLLIYLYFFHKVNRPSLLKSTIYLKSTLYIGQDCH